MDPKPPVTFETECYGYGPTSGGGRIYDRPTRGPKAPRVRGKEAKARRALKRAYRTRVPQCAHLSFKEWMSFRERRAA